jgi:transmembrane sensor
VSDENLPPERRAWRTDDEWNRLRERISAAKDVAAAPRSPFRRPIVWAAAAATLVIAAALGSRASHREPALAAAIEQVATTGVGERLTVHLDDSSRVTLGPRSTLRYAVSGVRREVRLDGIADFTVSHDATRPFVVRAKNAVVVDVGTEFVVRAYAADSTVEVAVTSGIVALSGTATPSIELRAGDAGRVTADGTPALAPALAAASSTRSMAAWMDGRLVFDDAPLSIVVAELSQWFDVEIRVTDARLARRRVSAVYSQPSLAGALNALTATLGARYERAGRVITIAPGTR